jgi:hypothetical protein
MADVQQIVLELLAKEEMSANVEAAAAAIAEMSDEEKEALRATDEYAEAVEKAEGQNQRMGLSLTDLKSGFDLAGQGLQKLKALWDFAKEGAEIERINAQWQATASDFGVNADAIVADLDRIAHGAVDDEALMQVASRAFTQELVTSGEQLTRFFEIARASSVRFGGEASQIFEQITQATELGTVKQLKALGIIVDFEQAYKDYASAVGLTVDQLDEQIKLEIRRNVVMEQGQKLVDKVGASTEDGVDKMKRFEKQIGDAGDELKTMTVDALTPVLDRSQAFTILQDENAKASDKLSAAIALNNDRLSDGYQRYSNLIPVLQAAADEEERLARQQDASRAAFAALSDERSEAIQQREADRQSIEAMREALFGEAAVAERVKATLEEVAQRHLELHAAAIASAQGIASSAQALAGFDQAAIAHQALKELDEQLAANQITETEWAAATRAVAIDAGFATEQSYAAARGLEAWTKQLALGNIDQDQFVVGLDRMKKAAQDGVVTLDELGLKTADIEKKTRPSRQELLDFGEQGSTSHAKVKEAANKTRDALDEANAKGSTLRDTLNSIPKEIKTKVVVDIQGGAALDAILAKARALGANV